MAVGATAAVTFMAIGTMFAWLTSVPVPFSPNACANVERYLTAHVVGQELALRQLADAVCTHVARHAAAGGPLAGSGQGDDDDDNNPDTKSLAQRALSGLVRGGKRAAGAAGGWVAAPFGGDGKKKMAAAAGKRRGKNKRRRSGGGGAGGQGCQQQQQQADASRQHNSKPLVISVHGPPGVGKTLTHTLLARAIYGRGDPALLGPGRGGGGGRSAEAAAAAAATAGPESLSPQDLCPGRACRGYRVFYGMDYLSSERAQRIEALRADLLSHLRQHADAVVVVEEYDKLDCAARSMWRHLLQRPQDANVSTLHRAVVLLESNLGMSELEGMLTEGVVTGTTSKEAIEGATTGGKEGDDAAIAAAVAEARERASAEEAERRLRDAVFARWRRDGCEAYEDTLKLVSLVDFFLPYFPLERRHVDELVARALKERARGFSALAAAAARAAGEEAEDEDEEEEGGAAEGSQGCEEGHKEADHSLNGTFWPPLPPRACDGDNHPRPSLRLAWPPSVVRFLSGRVEFSGPFPLEGAKGVESAVTRHVARLLRRASEALAARRREHRRLVAAAAAKEAEAGAAASPPPPLPPLPDTLLLFVAPGAASQELRAELMTAEEARARMAAEGEAEGEGGGRRPAKKEGACAAAADAQDGCAAAAADAS